MTVAYAAAQPFTGSRVHRDEARQPWETPTTTGGQGPVPWTLTAPLEEADWPPLPRNVNLTVKPAPRRLDSSRFPCPFCGSPTWRKGEARRRCSQCGRLSILGEDGALRKLEPRKAAECPTPKLRPNPYPCPDCGGRSKGRGSAAGGGSWRKCQDCGRNFRTQPAPPRTEWPPCPRPSCGGRTVSNGTTPAGKRILLCRSCKKSFRIEEAGEVRQEG